METELRQVTIEEYWPLIVRNTEEFGQIAVAENPEFNKLASCIYQVLQETFVRDATEYGVGRWENILKISPESGDTLEDRKARILTYLNVKLPYTVRVLRQMLVGLLGEENFTLTFDNDTSTLKVALALDTTQAQLTDVQTLLERVLPRNLVTDIDPFPCDCTRVEYLESTGTQWAMTNYIASSKTDMFFSADVQIKSVNLSMSYFCGIAVNGADIYGFGAIDDVYATLIASRGANANRRGRSAVNIKNKRVVLQRNINDTGSLVVDGASEWTMAYAHNEKIFSESPFVIGRLPKLADDSRYYAHNITLNHYGYKLYDGEELKRDIIPILDNTGTPCMFDTVTRTAFYNSGTGDFLYPGAEQAIQTLDLDLDAKSYAKLTEHGVRRLYHVPKGCSMTKDEYAAVYGFKELIEPPMPLEGYWMPEWRETETQLICDWVETEPPTEEVTENE